MGRKEKDKTPKFFYILTVFSLTILFFIIIYGTIKLKPDLIKNFTKSLVLGESTSLEEKGNLIERFVEGKITDTRETLSTKFVEAEEQVKSTLENEIKNFTQSQVDALKLKICTDWGVVETTPTPQNEESD